MKTGKKIKKKERKRTSYLHFVAYKDNALEETECFVYPFDVFQTIHHL